MTREQLRAVIAASVGDPASGPVAAVLDTIAAAVDGAVNGKKETRVTAPIETRDATT